MNYIRGWRSGPAPDGWQTGWDCFGADRIPGLTVRFARGPEGLPIPPGWKLVNPSVVEGIPTAFIAEVNAAAKEHHHRSCVVAVEQWIKGDVRPLAQLWGEHPGPIVHAPWRCTTLVHAWAELGGMIAGALRLIAQRNLGTLYIRGNNARGYVCFLNKRGIPLGPFPSLEQAVWRGAQAGAELLDENVADILKENFAEWHLDTPVPSFSHVPLRNLSKRFALRVTLGGPVDEDPRSNAELPLLKLVHRDGSDSLMDESKTRYVSKGRGLHPLPAEKMEPFKLPRFMREPPKDDYGQSST